MAAYPAPRAGDIVWCRFPEGAAVKPGRKSRPALVISVMGDSAPIRIRVAYGTSRRVAAVYPCEFVIAPEDGEAFEVSGLSYPTKFNLRGTVVLPYTSDWFTAPPELPFGATPKLGFLHPALMERARSAAAKVHR